MAKESEFQRRLVKRLYSEFPGCYVMKNESRQGVPDLLILYKDRWAMLECKKSERASHRPNQDYYVDHFNEMSFAAFIFPENEEEVFYELQSTFES